MESMTSAMLNPWLAELDMEDPLVLQEFIGDCLVDYSPSAEVNNDHVDHIDIDMAAANLIMDEVEDLDLHYSLSSASASASDYNSSTAASEVISTSSPSKRQKLDDHLPCSPNEAQNGSGSGLRGTSSAKRPKRQPEQCHNHIIAERQRRQTLSQRFIALSALIPGLKKMDKTSVLGEAISHMRELKERLKMLEEEIAKRAVQSVIVVRRSQVIVENDESSSMNSTASKSTGSELLPEIEARFSNESILIKIHCEMQKGILSKLLAEIERLNLAVTSTYAMPFSAATVDITIVVQREVEFDKTPQDVVKALRSFFERSKSSMIPRLANIS